MVVIGEDRRGEAWRDCNVALRRRNGPLAPDVLAMATFGAGG